MAQFKQKCFRCKTNYVMVTGRNAYGATCFDCQKDDLKGEITDPAIKKMLDIPEELYKESAFLRSIKINALKYGNLSEKQIEVFKSVVDKIKQKAKDKEEVKPESMEPTATISMRAERLAKAAKKKASKK